MNSVPQDRVEQVRNAIRDVLAGRASGIFLGRVDAVVGEWAAGKMTAAQACEKVQKMVSLFIAEDLSKEIGNRCAPIVMRESAGK